MKYRRSQFFSLSLQMFEGVTLPDPHIHHKQTREMQLKVYNASAGSGKTFRLAVEYIKLMVKNPERAHKGILAVTFTNKATEEMKQRIMSQLYGISRALPDSESYTQRVSEELAMDTMEVRRRAGIALTHLIHDFDHFKVETIDKFFQGVLRNLAHELGLAANLRVGLNDTDVEEMAVDKMIEELSDKDRELAWIIDFISKNIADNKSWNVTRSIKSFGKTIFKDVYKEKREEISKVVGDDKCFERFSSGMHQIVADFESLMASYEPRFQKIIDDNAIDTACLNSTMCGFFRKLADRSKYNAKDMKGKTYDNALEDHTVWVLKGAQKKHPQLLDIAERLLAPLHREASDSFWSGLPRYNTARMALTYINQLRLLGAIEKKVTEMNATANRFLLSDTQQLLSEFIKDSDSPFIYEKIGTQVNHIMIDEFQDTSTVQWGNFLVLLRDCMSRANPDETDVAQNLIVGDVKQSIYRWRSGDWRLLNNIESIFKKGELHVEPMEYNRRSAKNIVTFNNTFFDVAVKKEAETERETSGDMASQLEKAYSNVEQKATGTDGGEVEITLYPLADFQQQTLDKILSTVDSLLARGVPQNKIAILLRSNREIALIADTFMKERPEIHIVSDEAFRLDSSLAVNMIIEALTLLLHPDDLLMRATLAMHYSGVDCPNPSSLNSMLCDATEESINKLLPEEFVNGFDTMAEMPLTDLIEYIYNVLRIDRLGDQSAYVCAFYDAASAFADDYSPSIDALLQQWDEDIHKKTIKSDEIDGIRLLTIHKSKGLEFDNVILPFANWKTGSNDMLWCHTDKEPFCQMPLIPVKCKKEMTESYFAEDYKYEHLQTTVDNMNLLYVAFTRAANNLYIIGQNGTNAGRSAIFQQSLNDVSSLLDGATLEEEDDTLVFHYGDFLKCKDEKENTTQNVFTQGTEKVTVDVRSFPVPVTFRQSNKSIEFTLDEDDDALKHATYIKRGNILHNIFSKIDTKDDVQRVMREMEQDGVLYDEVTHDDLMTAVSKCLGNPVAAEWFSGKWKTFRECTILENVDGKMKEHRPDRVMTDGSDTIVVDYKFGTPKDSHHEQVRRYMRLLDDMGHQNIMGFLWYVDRNEIVRVRS